MKKPSNSKLTFTASATRSKHKKPVEIFVSEGDHSKPFYTFQNKKGQTIKSLRINPAKQYRFRRVNNALSHPFYISDRGVNQPATQRIKLRGDGDFDSGIVNREYFTLSIKKRNRRQFTKSGKLFFYCSTHPSMADEFIIRAGRKKPLNRRSEDPVNTDKRHGPSDSIDGKMQNREFDTNLLAFVEPWAEESRSWGSAQTLAMTIGDI